MLKRLLVLIVTATTVLSCRAAVLDLSMRDFLAQAAEPNVTVLGSTCAMIPALTATALLQKVGNLLAKHGTPNRLPQQALLLNQKMARQMALDQQYSARLIRGVRTPLLQQKEVSVLKAMVSLAREVVTLAAHTQRRLEVNKVPHLTWYQQDLAVVQVMARSSVHSIDYYLT